MKSVEIISKPYSRPITSLALWDPPPRGGVNR